MKNDGRPNYFRWIERKMNDGMIFHLKIGAIHEHTDLANF